MDQRKTLQMLMNKGRHELSECHSMSRRLDGTKGILFMRRDVACEALQKHVSMLTSRLTNILDQRLAQIEQVCQERELSLNEEKKQVLEKMTALTNMCGEANDYLQFGQESMCETSDCESLTQSLEHILQTNIEVSRQDQHTNLSYEPLLLDNVFQCNSVGMVKTSHLDPREIEIKQSNGLDRKLMIVTKGQNLCQKDLEHFKVKLVDSNGDNQPVDLLICNTQAKLIQAVFDNKQEEICHLEVKIYGIHVVNSPYIFQVNTGIDNDISYRSENSSYNSTTTTSSSVDNIIPGNGTNSDVSFDSPSPDVARKLSRVEETKRLQNKPDVNNCSSGSLSDRESSNGQDAIKTVNGCSASVPSSDPAQDSVSSTRKGPVMSSRGKNREHRGFPMPRAPLVSNRQRLRHQQTTYKEQVSKSDSCKTPNMEEIRSSPGNSDRKGNNDICKMQDAQGIDKGHHGENDVKEVSKCKPKSNDIANNCLKDETVSDLDSKSKQVVPPGAHQTNAQSNPNGCKINSKDNTVTKNSEKKSTVPGHQSKLKNVEPPGAYQAKIDTKFSERSTDTRNVETPRQRSNYNSPQYVPYSAGQPGSYSFHQKPFVPYKPPALRKPHNHPPNYKHPSSHKQIPQQKTSSSDGGRVKLKLGFPHTCRRDLNINTADN